MCLRPHYFPLILAVYLPLTFFLTYGLAVVNGHVEPVFPYISDTGNLPPESCVFSQLVNIFAAMTAWCMFLRYKQVKVYYEVVRNFPMGSERARSISHKLLANKACLIMGLVCATGISIVANFQLDHQYFIHTLGALIAYGGACSYCWIQTLLSYKMGHLPNSRLCCRHARTVLSMLYTISLFTTIFFTYLSLLKFPGTIQDIKKWNSTQPGYQEHVIATFAEWIMTFLSSSFFLTFVNEMKIARFKLIILSTSSNLVMESMDSFSRSDITNHNTNFSEDVCIFSTI